jgi:RNA polymerase subunit RPABC4/transcription elongation factor Spt4
MASTLMPGIVACNKCGARFAEGVQYCGRCSNNSFSIVSIGETAGGNACPRCSAQLQANSKFCGKCGLNTNQTAAANIQHEVVGFTSKLQQNPVASVQKICHRCGSVYSATVKYCGRCGIEII